MCMARPNWSVHCLRQILMRATQRAVLSLPAAIAGQNADPSSPLAAVPTAAAAGQRAADDRCRALLLPARHRQYRVHAAAQVQQVRQCSAAQRSAAAPRPAEPSLSPSLRCASACACFAVPYRAGAACASGSWRAGPMVSLCLLVNTADPLACIAGLPLSSYASCPAACSGPPLRHYAVCGVCLPECRAGVGVGVEGGGWVGSPSVRAGVLAYVLAGVGVGGWVGTVSLLMRSAWGGEGQAGAYVCGRGGGGSCRGSRPCSPAWQPHMLHKLECTLIDAVGRCALFWAMWRPTSIHWPLDLARIYFPPKTIIHALHAPRPPPHLQAWSCGRC